MLSTQNARIRSFKVVPSLPEPLKPLLPIARNLWWTWHPEAVELFHRLDAAMWRETHHNPVKMLGNLPQQTLDAAAADEGFLNSLQHVTNNLARHLDRVPWLKKAHNVDNDFTIAYFCTEFGLTECLQIYSGGLGCLAGDHLKSASELGMPLVAIGFLYRNGYFQQYLNADGWQQEYNPELDFANLPVEKVKGTEGEFKDKQIRIRVQMPGREIQVGLWKCTVGRIRLFLLDTNLPENSDEDRAITSQLYGGDMEMRIKQEIVLGIGGVHALSAMGIEPDVCHMNEGHSAFLALERIRRLIEKHDLTFDQARVQASASHVFTTHTPVPAGIDRFPPEMVTRYFKDYVSSLKLDMEGLLALGRENVYNTKEMFSMAVLAIRTADWANGVSKLHGHVSRDMWKPIWPGVPDTEIPIGHVTNGVHARSWLSGDMIMMLDRYLGNRWQADPADHAVWEAVNDIPDEEIWRVHERRRQHLILWARRRLTKQLEARGVSHDEIIATTEELNPSALTIGFARRFATYKRGTLMFRDPERLMTMLENQDRPMQFLIAGKAHPADGGGKDLIRQIVQFARDSKAGHRIVFLENYDIHVARYLVQGCDIWLNTPRRGMEASGTSGMKAALNGVLNCSILDGWWDEAYADEGSDVGWAIGRGENYSNLDHADEIESRALMDLLDKQIMPMFYDRDRLGLPRRWIARMKMCIAKLAPVYNTNRMVQDYAEQFYIPALQRTRLLRENKLAKTIELDEIKRKLRGAWGTLAITDVMADTSRAVDVHQALTVKTKVQLGKLTPNDVRVELFYGPLDNDGNIADGQVVGFKHLESTGDNQHVYEASVTADTSGRFGFAVRITPGHPLMTDIVEPGMILWDKAPTAPKSKRASSASPA